MTRKVPTCIGRTSCLVRPSKQELAKWLFGATDAVYLPRYLHLYHFLEIQPFKILISPGLLYTFASLYPFYLLYSLQAPADLSIVR